jgi:hypothetical protein
MSLEIPKIDNCCEKETYAFFGLAAYWAQVLEHSALNLAIVLSLPGVSLMSQEIFDNAYSTLTKKTFGQVLKSIKGNLNTPEADELYLSEALELRNILTHHYFRGHAENLVSVVGRQEIKKELQLIISKLKRADQILEGIYAPLWEKYGVTEEFINEHLEELRIKAEIRDKDA